MDTVASTAYDIFNRKFFSLPKVLLLTSVMSRQPLLIVQVFPFIFLSDWLKANAVSYMTTRIETMQKEIADLNAMRTKVESFDMKNAELLQRSGTGATRFTQRRWERLTVRVQTRLIVSDLITRSKNFFSFIQRRFVFNALIDCALASLIAVGKIMPNEVFVFSRAIEDAVDMVLMRSRGEAELARMMTEIDKLIKLQNLLQGGKDPAVLPCHIPEKGSGNLILRNLRYTRGTASASADNIELKPGVYALTGANGSGKSTLFRILMSCDTNEKSIDLDESINFVSPVVRSLAESQHDHESCDADGADGSRQLGEDEVSITMPSSHTVEISQNFYWPLYSKPIDWIFQDENLDELDVAALEKVVRQVAVQLHSLDFFQAQAAGEVKGEDGRELKNVSDATSAEATIARIMSELKEVKEDWFGDLSGGQKSKVELVRTVFLRKHCPGVLLIDETFAPLDPASKEVVMAKLKLFCKESIIIVIYHTDIGQGNCVHSNDFFDLNVHLEKGVVQVKDTC